MKRLAESDLAVVVIEWLEALGADVYQEVELTSGGQRADIVARVGAEIWIIETKTSMSLALIEQAMERRRHAHRVFVAAPCGRARAGADLCRDVGIGVLDVLIDGYDGKRVREVTPSRRWNSRPVKLAGRSPFRSTVEQLTRSVRSAGPGGMALKAAVDSIKHHYQSNAGARSILARWVIRGRIPGIRFEAGTLFIAEPTS